MKIKSKLVKISQQVVFNMKLSFTQSENKSRNLINIFLVLLFLLSTGFHNHAIQIVHDSNLEFETHEQNSDLLNSIELCTAHIAQSGMDRTFVNVFQIKGLGYFENLISYDEPSYDLKILSRNSPRSPPFV